jgi:hypothetical protein
MRLIRDQIPHLFQALDTVPRIQIGLLEHFIIRLAERSWVDSHMVRPVEFDLKGFSELLIANSGMSRAFVLPRLVRSVGERRVESNSWRALYSMNSPTCVPDESDTLVRGVRGELLRALLE